MLVLYTLLKERYRNPVIFSLDYSLVPHCTFPTALNEAVAAYEFVKSLAHGDEQRICLAGDSAGGTLMLSLLLRLAKDPNANPPGYATMLSPWVTLVSERDQNTASDFIDADSLHNYGRQYAGTTDNLKNPLASPGSCTDLEWWKKACPQKGMYLTYGGEEMLAAEIRAFVKMLRKAAVGIRINEEPGEVHAWVIANLYLGDSAQERTLGMRQMVKAIASNIEPGTLNGVHRK